jgi:hypothetical protein
VGLGACGDQADYANKPRPPAPIVITASIANDGVSVSPARFGAGPISLIVTNQTGRPHRIRLESVKGPGIRQQAGPVSPRDTATLRADVLPGRYTVGVGGDRIRSATLRVGPSRPSAQDELLQP